VQALRHFRQRVQALAVCLIGFVVWPAVPLAAQSHHFVISFLGHQPEHLRL
jgi:hypothetical protein